MSKVVTSESSRYLAAAALAKCRKSETYRIKWVFGIGVAFVKFGFSPLLRVCRILPGESPVGVRWTWRRARCANRELVRFVSLLWILVKYLPEGRIDLYVETDAGRQYFANGFLIVIPTRPSYQIGQLSPFLDKPASRFLLPTITNQVGGGFLHVLPFKGR